MISLHRFWLTVIGVILLVGALAFWRHDIQIKAIAQAQIQQVADSVSKERAAVKVDAQLAQVAAQTAEAQQAKALQLVAAGRVAAAKADSSMRAAADERERAIAVLADSLSSARRLHDELRALVSRTAADSAGSAQRSTADASTIRSLLAALLADSTALAAERSHSASLTALAASLTAELKQVKAQSPSPFGQAVKLALTGLAAFEGGRLSAGKLP